MTTALFPGSFDPFHNGHLEILETAARLFDEVVVAPMPNTGKAGPLFSIEQRLEMVGDCVAHLSNVSVRLLSGLVVDGAASVNAQVIVKGLRTSADADPELEQARMNMALSGIPTLLVACSSQSCFLASRYVRDVARLGDVSRIAPLVPPAVFQRLKERG